MSQFYNEKLIENFIKDYPKEFLGENLRFHSQQPILSGFRPDLVFLDENNSFVIVEVQLNSLDRNHFYRGLEYRDLLQEEYNCTTPRIILFANQIPDRYLRLAQAHNIEMKFMSKTDFIRLAQHLSPNLNITTEQEDNKSATKNKDDIFRLDSLLQLISNSTGQPQQSIKENAIALIFPCSIVDRNIQPNEEILSNNPLPDLTQEELLLNYNVPLNFTNDSIIIKNKLPLPVNQLPVEVFILSQGFEKLSIEDIYLITDWLDLLLDTYATRKYSEFIVLGYRTHDEIYAYEEHIRGRIKKFKPLWDAYNLEEGHSIEKLKKDIDKLNSISFLSGKFPNLKKVGICECINILEGCGPLEKNIHRRRAIIKQWVDNKKHGYTDSDLEDFDSFIVDDKSEWLTIEFINIDPKILYILKEVFRKIIMEKNRSTMDKINKLVYMIGISRVRRLSDISEDALLLSAKYLRHIG